MVVTNRARVKNLDLYDDFEDNTKTGRADPYWDIVDATAGTTTITSTSPISGTYSIQHLGNGASGTGNTWKYESAFTGAAINNGEYSADFDFKFVSVGAEATGPAAYLWVYEYIDGNNYTVLYTDYSGGNQRVRLFQKIGGVLSTLATGTWISGGKATMGTVYNMHVRMLDNTFNLKINGTAIIAVGSVSYIGPTATYHGGGGGDYNAKVQHDNIVIQRERAYGDYQGARASIGAIGSELGLEPTAPSAGATDDSTTLTFNVMSDFPVQLEITNWDDSVYTTKQFVWSSTNQFSLGYDGLDQYMSLRLRFYLECTNEANVSINKVQFVSE